jgi:hypothetical protein
VPDPVRRRRLRVAAAVVSSPLVLLAACGDDDGGDTQAFCTSVAEDQQLIFATSLDSPQAVDDMLQAMRSAGQDAPLAIEAEWDELTSMFDAVANGSLPFDDDDIAPVYMSERSAVAIQEWLAVNCGIDIAVGRVPNPLPQPSVLVTPGPVTTSPVAAAPAATAPAG